MSDDVFRMVVAAGVVIAALSFVVQAIVGVMVLRATRKMQRRGTALSDRAEPLIERAGPVIDKVGPLLEEAKPAIAKLGTRLEKVGELIDSLRKIVEEARPQIREISGNVVEISKAGKVQVERLGDLLTDAGEKARTRLEQIDATVGSTVESVEQVSQNVKRAVTRPVREV